mmetsp:Transcript_17380/g.55383  ORF Transcript_17380/g.55383 Transcript_17380/m.55383 type:complete len:94 (+) Transcript_17380:85-366(+)
MLPHSEERAAGTVKYDIRLLHEISFDLLFGMNKKKNALCRTYSYAEVQHTQQRHREAICINNLKAAQCGRTSRFECCRCVGYECSFHLVPPDL